MCGDSACVSQKTLIGSKAPKAKDFTNQRVRTGGEIGEAKRSKNHNKSKIRARLEHFFAVVQRLWGFAKMRYRRRAQATLLQPLKSTMVQLSLGQQVAWVIGETGVRPSSRCHNQGSALPISGRMLNCRIGAVPTSTGAPRSNRNE